MRFRDALAARMTPEQIAEAQRLARTVGRRAPACAVSPALHPLPVSGRMASPLRDGRQEDPLLFQLDERLWREQLTMREDIHALAERLHAAHACEP